MATFYTGVDKSIYQGGDHYVPMEQFRLNPYEKKNLSYESSQPQSYGITNTNAFTNSGGAFNASGNAFGYGTAIKPGDPSVLWGGKPIRSADVDTDFGTTLKDPTDYRGQSGYYGSANYQRGLPGDIQQSGPGRHFEYDDSGQFYRDYSLTPKKEFPGWARVAAGFIPGGNFALNFIENRMNPEGPLTADDVNKGRYAMGGLDAIDKKAYDELAGSGLLFEGSSGVKTITGKNFGAKGYFEGQKEIYDNLSKSVADGGQGFSMNENGEVVDEEGNVIGGFKAKQFIEASKMYNFKQEKDEQAAIDLQKEIDDYNFKQAAKVNPEILSPDNPLIGKIDHTGGGITRDPGSKVEGAPTHRTRDDLMATGGRVGLRYGGLLSIL